MSNPTPDLNVTRDNQQQPPQLMVTWDSADRDTVVLVSRVDSKGITVIYEGRGKDGMWREGHAPQPIPAPAEANEAEIHRTPRTDAALETIKRRAKQAQGITEQENSACALAELYNFARELERENNTLLARVADKESQIDDAAKAFSRIRSLCVIGDNGHMPAETYVERTIADLRAQLAAATSRADALQREREETRKGRDNYIKLYTGAVDDLTTTRAELAKWREAMQSIAIQKLSTEMNPTESNAADFETGYDMCIEDARRTLTAAPLRDARDRARGRGEVSIFRKLMCRLLLCGGHVDHEKDAQGIWWVGLRCATCRKLRYPIKSKHEDK